MLKGFNQPVLYLDFDGVLHHQNVRRATRGGIYHAEPGRKLFEFAYLLEQALESFPQVGIVLSTTWVPTIGYSKTLKRMPCALAARCIGATYHSTFGREQFDRISRGYQVLKDVGRRKPSAWFAIDDVKAGFEHLAEFVVHTDEDCGLTTEGAMSAVNSHLARIVAPNISAIVTAGEQDGKVHLSMRPHR